ncbi:heat shock factor protein 5 [Patagioenas fasciata]|uniref:heat shock factor protein 5 n=1 Tax=Patagioenas fasciata TaxID=372321 RepID=UPI0032E8ADDF
MEESQLPPSVNPSNFPAKLWRLVNSPRFRSICWDARGEGLLIDQPLFERELLGAGPDRAVGPAGDGAAEAIDLFKTKNFTSFVRQLNLYGFRKLLPGPEGSAAGPLLHFHSPHFRRDRPELLVQLKRLTSANKAKLAAGLEVTSRPPNRFQRLFGSVLCGDRLLPPATAAGANGLLSLGRFHQPYHRERFFPYSYISTSSQSNGTLLTNSLGRPPVPPRTWQGSLGLLPGHGASPAFPDKGVAFPMLQRLTTEVTYTLRPVASLLPLQQGSQTIATSLPKYSSSSNTASMQYSQAYYPTASLQRCSPPAHVDPLTGCAGPAASTYTHCSFFQSPPVQSPYAAEFLPSNWPCHTSDASEKTEVNLEAVFQIADKMYSPPKPKVVKVEPVESECSTPLSSGGHQLLLLVNSETGDTPSTGDSQLELLTAVTPDVLFVMEPDQAETCSPSQPPEFLCAAQTVASIESAAVEIVRELMTAQQACEKLGEQPDHCPSQSSLIFIQQEPFSLEQAVVGAGNHVSSSLENPLTKQENTGAECESGTSDTQEFTLGTQPVNKSGEKTDSCVKPQCRKRRHSSDSDKSPDFHLLVDVACKKGCFPKEETKE